MPDTVSVLLVEDDHGQRSLLKDILTNADIGVVDEPDSESAILRLKTQSFDVVFSDWKLPNLSGLDLLKYIRKQHPEIGFVMATAHGTISHAVEAMQCGADDYLSKPFQRQELLLAIDKAYRAANLRIQNQKLSEALSEQNQLTDFVGVSEVMNTVHQRISRIAPTDASVLITGESGTGKELAARSVHQLSNRNQQRFVAINCGAIPAELAEAELFGAAKGAYTGANTDKTGKLSFADKGTLFLDEIGELPLTLQAKILRFLQEGTITPLGSNEESLLDVRVIAATHRDLPDMVSKGEFREDLYYRLNIVPVHIPSLRERKEDIPLLADFFLRQRIKQYGLDDCALDATTINKLKAYPWPGNVRELSNRIERFVLLGDESELIPAISEPTPGSISTGDKDTFTLPEQGLDFEKLEISMLQQALQRSGGNKTRAAKLLHMTYKAFLYRLDKHQLG